MMLRICVITGPTASGKSDAALAVAQHCGGEIICADSMQLYEDLEILTARPDADALAMVRHHMYGILPASEPASAAWWSREAVEVIRGISQRDRLPVLVGGTGLYLKALIDGLSPIPDIPAAISERLRQRCAAQGSDALHEELTERDPDTAERLPPGDSQRIIRALEVLEATGRALSEWQAMPRERPLDTLSEDIEITKCVIAPPRAVLYKRCDERFDRMIEAGALDEVAALAEKKLDPVVPAMRALGVPQLMAYLRGDIDRQTAIARAKTATRRYAKRQLTWLRHQFPQWRCFWEKDSESLSSKLIIYIQKEGLTR